MNWKRRGRKTRRWTGDTEWRDKGENRRQRRRETRRGAGGMVGLEVERDGDKEGDWRRRQRGGQDVETESIQDAERKTGGGE